MESPKIGVDVQGQLFASETLVTQMVHRGAMGTYYASAASSVRQDSIPVFRINRGRKKEPANHADHTNEEFLPFVSFA